MYEHIFLFLEKKSARLHTWPHLLSQRVGVQWRDRATTVPPQWLTKSSNECKYVLFFMLFCFFLFFYLGGWRNQNSLINVCLFMRSKVASPSRINWLNVLQFARYLEKCYFFPQNPFFLTLGFFILHIRSFRRGDKLICNFSCTVDICLNEMWVSGWDIWLQKGQGQSQDS